MVTFSQVVSAVGWLNAWCPTASYSVRIEDDGYVHFVVKTFSREPKPRSETIKDYWVVPSEDLGKFLRESILGVCQVVPGLNGQEEVRRLLGGI